MATNIDANLRKAAVLIRSLDGDTAAMMLGQLSAEEAATVRAAIRALGPLDPEEQADIAAEFRLTRPVAEEGPRGVELTLSSPPSTGGPTAPTRGDEAANPTVRRFEFLAHASVTGLVLFLSREHAQTIAVVLAHLPSERAASVLAALPEKLQADTIERLAALGEADPESVVVLERELASWLATRGENRGLLARRRETVAGILAATDAKTRRGIMNKLRTHNISLAEQLTSQEASIQQRNTAAEQATRLSPGRAHEQRHIEARRTVGTALYTSKQASDTSATIRRGLASLQQPAIRLGATPATAAVLPRIAFDTLSDLDNIALAALLREVDANVLAVALVGAREEIVERICQPMSRRAARAFRRELRRLGPVRLSDIETAQRAVAEAAARLLAGRRAAPVVAS